MMKTLLFSLAVVLSFSACDRKPAANQNTGASKPRLTREQAVARIDSLEQHIRDSVKAGATPDVRLSMYAIQAYEYFAHDFPKDSLAPGYLFKAAQNYEGVLNDYPKAIQVYERAYEKYPEYKRRPMLLFHQGNLYHELGDTTKAVAKLQSFLKEYPKHAFANDAQNLINYIRLDEAGRKRFYEEASRKGDADRKAREATVQ